MDEVNVEAIATEFEHMAIHAIVGGYYLRDIKPLLADPDVCEFIELEVFSSLEDVANQMEFDVDAPDHWKRIGRLESASWKDQADEFCEVFTSLMHGIVAGYQGPNFSSSFLASVYVDVHRSLLCDSLRLFGDPTNPFSQLAQVANNYTRNLKLSREFLDASWRKLFSSQVAKHGRARTIELLIQFIERPSPLFAWTDRSGNERHMAWLFLIDLLREAGRYSEALAWTSLECLLYSENVTAHAMREELKREAGIIYGVRESDLSVRVNDEWEGVAGMQELKVTLENDIIFPFQRPELYRTFGVALPNGVLLYGPPGCGKTFIARKLAARLGFHFIEVRPSTVGSPYVHGTQLKLQGLFKEAREKAPTLIFLDEFDAFAPIRKEGMHHHYNAEVNELLAQLDGCSKQRVLVVAATNRLKSIDLAVRRPGRMDKIVFVPPPDAEARLDAFGLFLKDRPHGKIDFPRVVEYSNCCTYAEIEFFVNEAARTALCEAHNITTDDIINAILAHPPMLTLKKIADIEREGQPS